MDIKYNLLDSETFGYVQSVFQSDEFPWFLNTSIAYPNSNISVHDCQFTHTLVRDYKVCSKWMQYIEPVLYKAGIRKEDLARAKVNCTLATDEPFHSGMHTDFGSGSFTTYVFYINTNNGGTAFDDGTFVKSEENKLVSFDGMTMHTAVSSTDTKYRIVLNLNVRKL